MPPTDIEIEKYAPWREVRLFIDPTTCDLSFTRRKPKTEWFVPRVATPLYWFDEDMLKKKLIARIDRDLFIIDGHRFRAIVQDRHVIGKGYTRWLVFEESTTGEKPK